MEDLDRAEKAKNSYQEKETAHGDANDEEEDDLARSVGRDLARNFSMLKQTVREVINTRIPRAYHTHTHTHTHMHMHMHTHMHTAPDCRLVRYFLRAF